MRVDMFPEHMLSVRATVEPGRETEFNRWYDEEHVPDAVRMLPGCIGAARYKVVLGDGSHQYMALYAFESAAKLAARSSSRRTMARTASPRSRSSPVTVRPTAPS